MSAARSFELPEVGPLYVHEIRNLADPGLVRGILEREREITAISDSLPDALPPQADTPPPEGVAVHVGPQVLWAAFKSEGIDPENMVGFWRVGPSAVGTESVRKIKKAVDPATFFLPMRGAVYNQLGFNGVVPELRFQGVGEAVAYTALKGQRQYRPVLLYVAAEHAQMRAWAENQGLQVKKSKEPIMTEFEPDNHKREVIAYVSDFDTVDFLQGMVMQTEWLKKSLPTIDL